MISHPVISLVGLPMMCLSLFSNVRSATFNSGVGEESASSFDKNTDITKPLVPYSISTVSDSVSFELAPSVHTQDLRDGLDSLDGNDCPDGNCIEEMEHEDGSDPTFNSSNLERPEDETINTSENTFNSSNFYEQGDSSSSVNVTFTSSVNNGPEERLENASPGDHSESSEIIENGAGNMSQSLLR